MRWNKKNIKDIAFFMIMNKLIKGLYVAIDSSSIDLIDKDYKDTRGSCNLALAQKINSDAGIIRLGTG
jgi:hypothetical protein